MRSAKILARFCGGLLALMPLVARGQELLDRLGDALTASTPDDKARVHASGLLDVEGYVFEHPAPGQIDTDHTLLFNPRLTVFLDAQIGPELYIFGQARLDRGFDPGDHGPRLELDEYALRYTPWKDGRFNAQFGKSATVVGNWSRRHLSWDNPFINAPLAYEDALLVSDTEAPERATGFGPIDASEKYEYPPVIWGPSYTTGLTLSGRTDHLDYAFEIKNAALSSRPESWNATEIGFDHPSYSARLGYRPDVAWNIGVSASDGAYLRPEARPELPRGQGLGDYRQFLFGQDVSYAAGHWQFWAECFESRFERPYIGNLDVFSYYLEAKYKFTPQLFGALRWNQQLTSSTPGDAGRRDTKRIDGSVGYRFTEHLQLKLQYSYQDGNPITGNGSTGSTQLTLRF